MLEFLPFYQGLPPGQQTTAAKELSLFPHRQVFNYVTLHFAA